MKILRHYLTRLAVACVFACSGLLGPSQALGQLNNSFLPFVNTIPQAAIPVTYPVPGYTAWYNPTTIQHTGSTINACNDASANAFHLSTVAGGPVYTASAINGLAGITFNQTS